MLFKRVIAAVLVRHGIAVQSFGFSRWLPLGDPIRLVENLDRWGVDEIAVISLDRHNCGPDFRLLKDLSELAISTPLAFGGGITTSEHALSIIKGGAERIIIDSLLFTFPDVVRSISLKVGAQAIIGSIPLINDVDSGIKHFHYLDKSISKLSCDLLDLLHDKYLSEILIMDVVNEGFAKVLIPNY